ncbi:MAG: lytic transglycosylase domain-containing protein [Gammaproteobacteria bacterium]|nr:lytic transglycosylase domain-containing protein [Gammaproteobacteria bacterium]
MHYHTRIASYFLALLLVLQGSSVSAENEIDIYTKQRLQYLDAEKYFRTGQTRNYKLIKNQLVDYPLYPYLLYKDLRKKLHLVDGNQVRRYLYKYGDTPVGDKLRKKYLFQLAQNNNWDDFIVFYKDYDYTKLSCLHRKALYKTGKIKEALESPEALWLSQSSLPTTCNFIVTKMFRHESLSSDLQLQRLKLAVRKRNIRLAYYLSDRLTNSAALKQQIRNAHHFPIKYINKHSDNSTDLENFLFIHSVVQLAKKDFTRAVKVWESTDKEQFKRDDLFYIERKLSYYARKNINSPPNRKVLFDNNNYDSNNIESRIRLNLAKKDWQETISNIDNFSELDGRKEEWLYWRARSLEKLGNYIQAYRIFDRLSETRSYYGFLSADKLNKPYNLNQNTVTFNKSELEVLRNNPFFLRAVEFSKIGRPADTRREIYYLTENLEEGDLYKLSQLAHEQGWNDVAILTIAKTPFYDDLKIRFPLISIKDVEELKIDEAWLHGLIRQESLFMLDAMSNKGALGLMQLLPRTARSVAKRSKTIKKRWLSDRDLLDKDRNIILGSSYLFSNLRRFDNNPVLATAAYNAGPRNVKKWIPNIGMSADIWIETIPFKETRNYVQRVLTYTSIYERKLGIMDSKISDRMPDILVSRPKS